MLYALYYSIVFGEQEDLVGCFLEMFDWQKYFPVIRKWKELLRKNGWDVNSGLSGEYLARVLIPRCDFLRRAKEKNEKNASLIQLKSNEITKQSLSVGDLWNNIKRFRAEKHSPQTIFVNHDMTSGEGHAYCVKLVWPEKAGEPAMLIAETRLPDSFEDNKKHAKLIFDLFTSASIPQDLSQN